ncbi:RNA polymerase subunit sigma-70 [Streptomyces uncialis]|uniref:RNA polymerase subunit sigma-70 n=1 Tax=Streptomyces uncialis TaxID=1048205 RepID=UPI002E318DE8|nr:RNA polymerase subunit sigma-70 [Streptomyces uncialis]
MTPETDVPQAAAAPQPDLAARAERHRGELRVHCYRMVGSYSDAEDLVQETLIRAWRKREQLTDPERLRAWLYRIATRVCLDFLGGPARSREVVTADSVIAEVRWLEPYPDSLLDGAIARETIELAYLAAIQHLPPRQRAVLILRDVLGFPAEETATALEMSVAAVKSGLQRARATLRTRLPERRADWGPATGPSAAERETLRAYVRASQRADLSALTALLRADARQTMPPASLVYEGRAAILDLWGPVLEGSARWGEWRSVEITVNRQPGAVNYVRAPRDDVFRAVNIDVLRIEDGLVAEITTFGPEILPALELPLTM